jgi:membrane protein involved in colicin uptake
MKFQLMSIAVGIAFALGAQAQTPSTQTRSTTGHTSDRQVKNADEDRIEAEYKAAREKCDPMQGNAKDVCQKEAKAKEKVAKAELKAKHDPSAANQRKVHEAKAAGDYDVAKERCDDKKGNEKDVCQKDAKAAYERAKADIKRADAKSAGTGSTTKASTK